MWQQFIYTDSVGDNPYFVYTPETYRVEAPVPLFVMLHGCTQTALDFATGTSMNQLAEKQGFIVMYPQQTTKYNQGLCWNWFLPSNQQRGSGEPASIVGMIQSLQLNTANWTIDPNRIYVTGISAGAAMSVILGATYPDVFAAIGVHSGLEYQAATNLVQAAKVMHRGGPDPLRQGSVAYTAMSNHSRVVPTIVFHGTADTIVAPLNGDQVVQQWIQTDYLASDKTYAVDYHHPSSIATGQVPGGYSYLTAVWNAPSGEAVQAYWKIDGMGHAWSGGNPASSYTDPRGPDATVAMYDFFMGHPREENAQQQLTPLTRLRHMLTSIFHMKAEE